jgi:ankyrin repeat protein
MLVIRLILIILAKIVITNECLSVSQLDVVERILMDGMSPDVIDPTQRTPLHYAAELGNYRYV